MDVFASTRTVVQLYLMHILCLNRTEDGKTPLQFDVINVCYELKYYSQDLLFWRKLV